MAPILYYCSPSPAVRGSLLVVKALGIDIELASVKMAIGEHLSPDFLKMNPFHTLPTLKDGDFVVWDSHAINIYLAEKYAPQSDLYPSDLQTRALIHQRMFFDTEIIFTRLGSIVVPLLREGAKTVAKDKADAVIQGYNLLEALLEKSTYVAGESLTIADLSLIATITSSNVLVPIAANRFPKITQWISKLQQLPYYQEGNQEGLDIFSKEMKSRLA